MIIPQIINVKWLIPSIVLNVVHATKHDHLALLRQCHGMKVDGNRELQSESGPLHGEQVQLPAVSKHLSTRLRGSAVIHVYLVPVVSAEYPDDVADLDRAVAPPRLGIPVLALPEQLSTL